VSLLLVCAAATSLILGMGMPSVVAYSLVAILVAPSLTAFGIPQMAAHFFVFYFSVISNITPPVAVSCFAAAPLAGANPTQVGITSFRLAIAAYIVPFVVCFEPSLVLVLEEGANGCGGTHDPAFPGHEDVYREAAGR
jgi:TRAP-type uncharacterized transport system fused permease subunit